MQRDNSEGSRIEILPMQISNNTLLNIPDNIIFPNELNEYFKDQLEHNLHENLSLKHELHEYKKQLDESKQKTEELASKLKEYEVLCGKNEFVSSSAVAANKIIELSRKLREKSSEVEVCKTRCSKLERALFELKEEIQVKPAEQPEEKPKNELEEQVKQLQEKLNVTKTKLSESKNVNLQLKNDLKLANKWLQQETGENFDNLANIHNSNANWRGRAQIICDLQKKNFDLREKLKNVNLKGINSSNSISKLEKKLEINTKENSELRTTLEQLKKKHDGAKARIRYLEAETTSLKYKISNLNEQNDSKQREISTLIDQLNIERQSRKDYTKQKEAAVAIVQQKYDELKIELHKKDCAIENLSKTIDEQKQELNTIRSRVRSSRPQSSYGIKCKEVSEETTAKINRLEAEKIRLLELTDIHNKRLENERKAHQKTECELRLERQKAAKLEAKLARVQLEYSSRSSTYSLSGFSIREDETDVLRNKLEVSEENIKSLETRLEVERHERKNDFQQFATILKNYSSNEKIEF